jgi:hypothetical protein
MQSALGAMLAVLLVALPSALGQQGMWEQCGGNGWTGGTACVVGAVCT